MHIVKIVLLELTRHPSIVFPIRTSPIMMTFEDKQQCSVSIVQLLIMLPYIGCHSWKFVYVSHRELQPDHFPIGAAIYLSFCVLRPVPCGLLHSFIRSTPRLSLIHIYGEPSENEARIGRLGSCFDPDRTEDYRTLEMDNGKHLQVLELRAASMDPLTVIRESHQLMNEGIVLQ